MGGGQFCGQGLSSTWGFATDTQPSPKSEELPAGGNPELG